ncbi:hypothetical protein [Methylovulum psychrotolerans]|uniref:Uncharacterized protein n=1 Tax=Methylovulum psychrotolerans TaxID=1704499 RepID=A0A2S5CNI8_9GAMM|nr:hypothetical protein [Methylovulum psychrotolerans]POZ52381.1 hypothetical protein AADEFJLK_01863 [Methylovulum psychrotolerans]
MLSEVERFQQDLLGSAKQMYINQRGSVFLSNASSSTRRVVIEPWAVEFELPSKSYCEVVSVGGSLPPDIEVEDDEYGFMFWINNMGAIYEYWQDGELID